MWPFTKKIKVKQTEKINMDCVFNSIISDLDEKRIEDWKHQYERGGWEYFRNLKKGYKLICYTDATGWLFPLRHNECFTNTQKRIIYEKCQEISQLQAKIEKENERQKNEETLKTLFPDCFSKA